MNQAGGELDTTDSEAGDPAAPSYPRGGVGFLVFNPSLTVRPIHSHNKGMCCVEISTRGHEPFAVIGVYNPPTSSTLNTRSERAGEWSIALLTIVREQLAALRAKYRIVLLCGDWNMRAGTAGGADGTPRITTDSRPSSTGRCSAFAAFLVATQTSIVHGSPGQPCGFGTSRPVAAQEGSGTAEVDAWLAPTSLLSQGSTADAAARAITALAPQLSWDSIPASMTHLPVSVVVRPTQLKLDEAAGQSPPPRLPRPPPRRPYPDQRYTSPELVSAVASWATDLHAAVQAGKDRDETYSLMVTGLRTNALPILASERPSGGTAETTLELWCRDSSRTPSGADIRAALRAAKGATRAYLTARRSGEAQPSCAVNALKRIRRDSQKLVVLLSRRVQRSRVRAMCRMADNARVWDSHKLYKFIHIVCPENPDRYQSSSAGLSTARALPYFQKLFKETRGPPPAILDHSYDTFLPKERVAGSGSRLILPIRWWEVYLVIFPGHHKVATAMQLCSPTCLLCRDYKERMLAYDWADPSAVMPQWKPTLHTCKAAGTDGLTAEVLRFTRPLEKKKRFPWRKAVCVALAAVFNTWLTHGVPTSEGFRHVVITPILKRLTEDPSNPQETRPISVGNLFPKLFELIFVVRITHWAAEQGIIHPQQIGFMPMQGAEMHVLTLYEMLQMRRAAGEDTCVLFVDIKGAYDNVHQTALWYVLRHAGVPEQLISTLSNWYGSRTASVRCEEGVSPSFPCDKGEPQGAPLACIFWNIFFESMGRMLERHPSAGVTLAGVQRPVPRHTGPSGHGARGGPLGVAPLTISHQTYADDLVVPTRDPAGAQAVLTSINDWCVAWGATLNCGQGKTELMKLCGSRAPTQPQHVAEDTSPILAPLHAGAGPDGVPRLVQWVKMYRYLGFEVTLDLQLHEYVARRVRALKALHTRFFQYNRVVNGLGVCTQLQLLNTLMLSTVNFLLAVLPVAPDTAKQIDTVVRGTARKILGLPSKSPSTLADLEMGCIPFTATVLSHHARLYYTLVHTPLQDSLSAKLARLQREVPCMRIGHKLTPEGYVPYAVRVESMLKAVGVHSRIGRGDLASPLVCFPAITHLHDITGAVAVLRRSVRYRLATQAAPGSGSNDASSRGYAERMAQLLGPPPPTPQTAHLLWTLNLDFKSTALGELTYATPFGVKGPACSGRPCALTTLPTSMVALPLRLRLGKAAFSTKPWRRSAFADNDDEEDTEAGSSRGSRRLASHAIADSRIEHNQPSQCPLCDPIPAHPRQAAREVDGPWHVMLECPHERMAVARERMWVAVGECIKAVCNSLAAAHDRANSTAAPQVKAVAAEVATLTAACDWASGDGKYVLFHLLCAAPWMPRVVTTATPAVQASFPLTLALGRLFEATLLQSRHLRATSGHIVRFAAKWIREFADARCAALDRARAP